MLTAIFFFLGLAAVTVASVCFSKRQQMASSEHYFLSAQRTEMKAF